MADREQKLRLALEAITRRYPHFHDAKAVSRLIADKGVPHREQMMLAAVVEAVLQCFDRYEDRHALLLDDERLTILSDEEMLVLPQVPAMPVAVDAVNALAEFGLMKVHPRSDGSDRALRDGIAQHGETVLVMAPAADPFVGPAPMAFCLAEWTEMGKAFLAENMQAWGAWEDPFVVRAEKNRKITAIFVDWTNKGAIAAAYFLAFLFMAWIVDHGFHR
ncbi:hypothetical protein JQ616_15425 [Bradyrhizobium tropiciagri]|uniref:hypothetical protein n=1 Tax=Bradyrhizobium tropiciagri TaxID=312253 RepID=UPI001BA68AD5|nr:hypothetical protein [Bradyrhizobium tropiciagri]MBR0896349.1 hypothetical protein [Bradyrhizobium tropiciagri]